MHGPSLIVAEQSETDKKVCGDVGASLSQRERENLKMALLTLILACSQMLNELGCDETYAGQQKRVDEAALMHHELKDKPDDEKK